jgi:hypothetical protein
MLLLYYMLELLDNGMGVCQWKMAFRGGYCREHQSKKLTSTFIHTSMHICLSQSFIPR